VGIAIINFFAATKISIPENNKPAPLIFSISDDGVIK
jgi:hypothetical protein